MGGVKDLRLIPLCPKGAKAKTKPSGILLATLVFNVARMAEGGNASANQSIPPDTPLWMATVLCDRGKHRNRQGKELHGGVRRCHNCPCSHKETWASGYLIGWRAPPYHVSHIEDQHLLNCLTEGKPAFLREISYSRMLEYARIKRLFCTYSTQEYRSNKNRPPWR